MMRKQKIVGILLGVVLTFSLYGFVGTSYIKQIFIEKEEINYLTPILKPVSQTPASVYNPFTVEAWLALKENVLNYTLDSSTFVVGDRLGEFSFVIDSKFNQFENNRRAEKKESFLTAKNSEGRDTILPFEVHYRVKKPYVRIQRSSQSALFGEVSNPLIITIPALMYLDDLRFNVIGGTFEKEEGSNDITVIPGKVDEVSIEIYADDQLIAVENFKVRKLKNLTYDIGINGGVLSSFDKVLGLKTSTLTSIDLVPSSTFEYVINQKNKINYKWSVTLWRAGKKIKTEVRESESFYDLGKVKAKAKIGDALEVKVLKASIVNTQGGELNLETGNGQTFLLR